MQNNAKTIILTLSILLIFISGNLLHAQGQVQQVVIPEGSVNYNNFPNVAINVIVSNDQRGRVEGLTGADFTLREDSQEMPFTLTDVEVGIQAVFVLDASYDARRSGATGYTRLEEGKQIITTFAQEYMAEGIDQIAVLAPESSTAIQKVAPLPDDPADFTIFKSTVRDGVYLYELPQGVANTPLNDMVSQALRMLEGAENELHKAVVVISDGIDIISDREVADIVRTAKQANIPIYTIVFGPAGNWGGQAESNMKRLSLDTYGEHFQLSSQGRKPEPLDTLIGQTMEPLFDNLVSQRNQYLLTYNSAIFSPGSHELAIETGGKSTKTGFSLNVRPPQVSIVQPAASAQITRSTDDPNLAEQDIEPRTQTVDFEVVWPDGYPRELESVDLLVDGVAAADTCVPPCSQIIWNIASLPAGAHSIRVRVRDKQGLEAESGEITLSINIITHTPVPTPTPTRAPTPTPVPPPLTCEETYDGLDRIIRCSPEIFSLLALLVSLLALVLVIVLIRRKPQVFTAVAAKFKEITEPFFPDRKVRGAPEARAILIVLEGDDPSRDPIELLGDNTRLGRDDALAQVTFNDRSVSRLHARISVEGDQRKGERFVLYDEGSTSGTYSNYEPVGIKGQWLQHNDIINLGRVRMQFKLTDRMASEGVSSVHDVTIPMVPIKPGESTDTLIAGRESAVRAPADEVPTPVDEFATEPYAPLDMEPGPDATQPVESQAPDRPESEDNISTEPFMPMDFTGGQ